jgi:hypothetical protein
MSERENLPPNGRGYVLTDIDIPFGRLIVIIVKIALAAIPAMIIVWAIIAVIMVVLASIFGTGFMMRWHMAPWSTGV